MKKLMSIILMMVLSISTIAPEMVSASEVPEIIESPKEVLETGYEALSVIYGTESALEEPEEVFSASLYGASGAEESYWNQFSSTYYYNQLSAQKKRIWDDLDASCMAVLVGNASITAQGWTPEVSITTTISTDDLTEVANLFTLSHPQYYFIKDIFMIVGDTGVNSVRFTTYEAFVDDSARATATETIKTKIDSWLAEINVATDKEKAAHDILCRDLEYNENTYDQSLYSAVNGGTVCTGYSKAFELLMQANGTDAFILTSATHAWDVIYDGSDWVNVDVLWDDQYEISYNFYNVDYPTVLAQDQNEAHVITESLVKYLPGNYQEGEQEQTIQLAVPTNLHWDYITSTWDPVENAAYYNVRVYKDGETLGWGDFKIEDGTSTSFPSGDIAQDPNHEWTFAVQACGNSDNVLASAFSAPSAKWVFNENEILAKIAEVTKNPNAEYYDIRVALGGMAAVKMAYFNGPNVRTAMRNFESSYIAKNKKISFTNNSKATDVDLIGLGFLGRNLIMANRDPEDISGSKNVNAYRFDLSDNTYSDDTVIWVTMDTPNSLKNATKIDVVYKYQNGYMFGQSVISGDKVSFNVVVDNGVIVFLCEEDPNYNEYQDNPDDGNKPKDENPTDNNNDDQKQDDQNKDDEKKDDTKDDETKDDDKDKIDPVDEKQEENKEKDTRTVNTTPTEMVAAQKADLTSSDYFGQSYKKYTVAPKGYATVSSKGLLTVKKAGTITITGWAKEGKTWVEKNRSQSMQRFRRL